MVKFVSNLFFMFKSILDYKLKNVETKNLRKVSNEWTSMSLRNKSFFAPDEFFLLNQWGKINPHGWTDPNKSLLWQYNQNYFDDLNSEFDYTDTNKKLDLINSWIDTKKLDNTIGWDPYPTSIRIVNWIKFHF